MSISYDIIRTKISIYKIFYILLNITHRYVIIFLQLKLKYNFTQEIKIYVCVKITKYINMWYVQSEIC